MASPTASQVLGIDFGAHRCVMVAMPPAGAVDVVHSAEGAAEVPSVVHFGRDGSTLVGAAAVQAAGSSPERSVVDVRSRVGDEAWTIGVDGVSFTGVDVAGLLLRKLLDDATAAVGDISGAAIAVPAYFHDGHRRGVLDAARSAGLPVLRLINESTAAALAYAAATTLSGRVLIANLGGGQLDLSLVEVESPEGIERLSMNVAPEADGCSRLEASLKRVCKDADEPDALGAIIVSGESPRTAELAAALERVLGRPPLDLFAPAVTIACGAAVQARMLADLRSPRGVTFRMMPFDTACSVDS